MIRPSFREFKQLAQQGNLVVLRREVPSDLETPVSAFLKLAATEPCSFLLESAEQAERIGRYSFLGFAPEKILTAKEGGLFLKEGNRNQLLGNEQELLTVLRRTLSENRLANPEDLPNFVGGWVGFIGYENVRLFEKVKLGEKKGLPLEDAVFFLVKEFLLFDHFKKTLSVISLCDTAKKTEKVLKKIYASAESKMRRVALRLERALPRHTRELPVSSAGKIHANFSKKEFLSRIQRIKEYIRAGDCIQVVFSQRFGLGKVKDDFAIYRALRSINPSPYMFYFRFGSLRLIGSSPEVLVRKTGRVAEVRPIAGTRVRGNTVTQDQKVEENLKRSKK